MGAPVAKTRTKHPVVKTSTKHPVVKTSDEPSPPFATLVGPVAKTRDEPSPPFATLVGPVVKRRNKPSPPLPPNHPERIKNCIVEAKLIRSALVGLKRIQNDERASESCITLDTVPIEVLIDMTTQACNNLRMYKLQCFSMIGEYNDKSCMYLYRSADYIYIIREYVDGSCKYATMNIEL